MNILWLNHRDPLHPQAGGSELRFYELSKRLVGRGHNVKLICERWQGSSGKTILDGIEISRISSTWSIHLITPMYLVCSKSFDIIIDDIAHAVPWFSPLFTSKPVIAQIHHIHQDLLNVELNNFLARFVAVSEKSIKYIYDFFIAVSPSTKSDLITRFKIPKEKITIIPNGVDYTKYSSISKSPYPVIIYVGRLKKYKRIDDILRAFQIIKRELPYSKLYIVGEGDYMSHLKTLSSSLGLTDVTFFGRVSEKEKIFLMSHAWITVSTSLIEGWGLSITENAACGTPSVVYDVPGLRDSVIDGLTGFIIKEGSVVMLAKKIIEVLRNKNLRFYLGKNALKNADKLNWEKITDNFENILSAFL